MIQEQLLYAASATSMAQEILRSSFYTASPNWVREASFALLMINMKDCLQILARHGERINFDDDIPEGDVTTLISEMRNAICHIGSPLRRVSNLGEHSFSVMVGQGIVMETSDVTLSNPYNDDVAFFYGRHMILLRRHVARAAKEAEGQIRARFDEEGWWNPFFLLG